MNLSTKQKVILLSLSAISVFLGAAYLQYRKLMDYSIKLKKFYLKSFSNKSVVVDIIIEFENKSKLAFDITSQSYEVYLNNIFLASVDGTKSIKIAPKSKTLIPLEVNVQTEEAFAKLKKYAIDIAAKGGNNKMKIKTKLKVKMYGITVNIPYEYEATFSEMKAGS